MSSVRSISIYSPLAGLRFSEDGLCRMLAAIDGDGRYPIPAGELSIALLDDETIAVLHGKFLGDATPTDVITFPGDPAEDFAGEICVAVHCAARSAAERKISLGDEISLYLVHGWLHLAGLGDKTPAEAERMRSAERELLDYLRESGLAVEFFLRATPWPTVQVRPATAGAPKFP
ncbi:MAG: rRNA maturation RNase YbeY [Puniceicoccales bacterium]|nr:rRNA maturation RNase YbeY [Puniceicoccales bacterium]